MSDPHIESLPADLAALLAREETAYPENNALKQAVFAHVEMVAVLAGASGPGGKEPGATGHGGAGGAAGAAGAAAAVKGAMLGEVVAVGLAAFIAGGAVGSAVTKATSPAIALAPVLVPSAGPAPVLSPKARAATERGEEVETTVDVGTLPIAAAPAPSPPRPTASPVSAAPTAGDLTRERELLDVARAALARGRPEDAIAAAERHAKQWPHGNLVEEREVVMIQALAAAGRRSEAEQRASHFRATFPKSVLLPVVNAATP